MIWTDESNQVSSSKSTLAAQVMWYTVPPAETRQGCCSYLCCFHKPVPETALSHYTLKTRVQTFQKRRSQPSRPRQMCHRRSGRNLQPDRAVRNENLYEVWPPVGFWLRCLWGGSKSHLGTPTGFQDHGKEPYIGQNICLTVLWWLGESLLSALHKNDKETLFIYYPIYPFTLYIPPFIHEDQG